MLTFCALLTTLSWAPSHAADTEGSHDNPIVSRFAGSTIIGYQSMDYGQLILPLGSYSSDAKGLLAKSETAEGHITRIAYAAPAGKTALEVYRNFQAVLEQAGFQTRFACEKDACGGFDFAGAVANPAIDAMRGDRNGMIYGLNASNGNVHALTTHLSRPQGPVDVVLLVSQSENQPTGVLLQICEGTAMASGEVSVDAKAMSQGLARTGHIALYGIHFGSDSAHLEADSKETLAQMAKLLANQPSLKVYIVGHTDNSGSLEHNLFLSEQRAEAVVKALTTGYGIDAARLAAKGLASYAPVASNHSDAGRAQNRRVELVEQ
ncbi:OmpA family protein [Frateuria defendens]|uniref:OmpA family protein n=1 Tax=Frateuria defendens TaxID=2219559 RepID=UPI001F1678AF|nr:OmpA family protein [Frateuria defendens]